MNRHTIFVYGSLLKGEPNHRHLASSTFLRSGRTSAGFSLLDMGAYPALVPGGTTRVAGEVYGVDDLTLAALDRLEGHPHYYRRAPVVLEDGASTETYLLVMDAKRRRVIEGGDWRLHHAPARLIRP
jgi:gamma-glutamylaminecyclotransferase